MCVRIESLVSIKRTAAAKKAWATRRIMALEKIYKYQRSAGKKAATRRKINLLKG